MDQLRIIIPLLFCFCCAFGQKKVDWWHNKATYMVKDQIDLGSVDPDSALTAIAVNFTDCEKNTVDGLKLIWKNKWLHIRKSNTEPIIRIYAEASKKEDALTLVKLVKNCL